MDFKDLNIDIFLEVPNEKYSYILYLIEYNAHGLHFCSKIYNFNENWASGSKQNVLERRQVLYEGFKVKRIGYKRLLCRPVLACCVAGHMLL